MDESCDGKADEGCPISLAFSNGATGPLFGKVDGGFAFVSACPIGELLRGLDVTVSGALGVYALGFRCAKLGVDPAAIAAGGASVTLAPGATLAAHGWVTPPDAGVQSYDCPEGVISGWTALEGTRQFGSFSVTCAQLRVSGAPGSFSLSTVTTGASPPQGSVTAATATPVSFSCPSPQLGVSFFGRAGSWVDQLGLQCATPSLVIKP